MCRNRCGWTCEIPAPARYAQGASDTGVAQRAPPAPSSRISSSSVRIGTGLLGGRLATHPLPRACCDLAVIGENRNNWCKQAVVLGYRCRRSAVKQLIELVLDILTVIADTLVGAPLATRNTLNLLARVR